MKEMWEMFLKYAILYSAKKITLKSEILLICQIFQVLQRGIL